MTDSRVFRYCVPVDDQWHDFDLTGPILNVDTRKSYDVEFWVIDDDPNTDGYTVSLKVFGTGHPLDEGVEYVGTAITPGGDLVWHLFRKAAS